MKNPDYEMNLPVHLARRDVFFGRAIEELSRKISAIAPEKRATTVNGILYLLKSSGEHAFLAMKSVNPDQTETSCLELLTLMQNQLESIRLMLNVMALEKHQKQHIMPFTKKNSGNPENPEDRIQDIINAQWKEIREITRVTDATLLENRNNLLKEMSPGDKARYKKASKGLKKHLKEKEKMPEFMSGRTFYAIPEKKHE